MPRATNKRPHPRYSPKTRQQAIARVLDSHISITQVAREIGCSLDTLHRWLRRHRRQATPSSACPDKATFVPINIIDTKTHPVEIVTVNGITIRLTDASPQYIAELLHLLASC